MTSWWRSPGRASAAVRLGLALALLAGAPVPLPAQAPGDPTLEAAREHLKNAEYDQAITILKESIEDTQHQAGAMTDRLRDLYLLLIKAYVVRSNASRFEPQGLETSRLYQDEARRWTLDCLQTPGLQDTRPDPGGDYPPEMFALFNEVVAEIFGNFRITDLEPAHAVVILDGDTLGVASDGVLGADNISAGGQHLLVIRSEGYRDWTEELAISPNATLERSYALEKDKGPLWWALRGGAAVGAAAAIFLLGSSSSGEPPQEPLPGPPPPPSSPPPRP